MKILKLWFTDFDALFKPNDNYIYHLLSTYYKIDLDPKNPDYLIYSCYGNNFLNYNCIRIFYTGENLVPDFNLCDYAIGFDYIEFGDRYLRFPNFAFYEDQFIKLLLKKDFDESVLLQKPHFCNFIYANAFANPLRDKFFYLLNKYKPVSSPGKHLNNTSLNVGERFAEDWMYSKINFQSSCKFSIAFENTSSPGYTTEKILHAFISNTVPIYWGNPLVTKDFNPKALINCHDFETFEEVIQEVQQLDKYPEKYISMLNEPPFLVHKVPDNLKKEKLLTFFVHIFENEVGTRRSNFGTQYKYEKSIKANLVLRKKLKILFRYATIIKKPFTLLKRNW